MGDTLRLFVGDDWAEAHYDVELMDATGRRLAKARLPEGVARIARLHAMIGGQLGEDADEDDAGQVECSSSTVSREREPVLLSAHYPRAGAGTGPVAPDESEAGMAGKAVISLSTGLEDPEKVTVAFLVAVGAAESGRPTLMFQAKEAVRLALEGTAAGVACDGCPSLPDLLARYEKAGGRYMVCPVCFNAKKLDKGGLLPGAELAGSVQLWEWIGDDAATTFSY